MTQTVYDMDTRKVHVSRDVKFDEEQFTLAKTLSRHALNKQRNEQEPFKEPHYDGSETSIKSSKPLDKHEHFDTYFEREVLPELKK